MEWYNEPAHWQEDGDTITVTAEAMTDFWRITHDGGIRDNGHFYYQPVTGDFVAEVKFGGEYNALYDQAGLMIRADTVMWLKCGIELYESVQHVSTVVTRAYSDWSIQPLPDPPPALWLRVRRQGATIEVFYSCDGETYALLRQAYLAAQPLLQVGVMCCAPTGDGFPVVFEGFTIRPGAAETE